MSIFTYLGKLLCGLPAYDSIELIEAKKYRPYLNTVDDLQPGYDLYEKEMDLFMFGAIAPKSDANDQLSSQELEKRLVKDTSYTMNDFCAC